MFEKTLEAARIKTTKNTVVAWKSYIRASGDEVILVALIGESVFCYFITLPFNIRPVCWGGGIKKKKKGWYI